MSGCAPLFLCLIGTTGESGGCLVKMYETDGRIGD